MILDTAADRVLVISDLHLGSPASSAAARVPDFLDAIHDKGWTLVINGDGFDLLQSSWKSLMSEATPVLRRIRKLIDDGTNVFYTVGNHDLVLENLLDELPFTVTPFLNLKSGGKRIRIEHGHLYEPFYAKHPRLYEFGGRIGRPFLLANQDTYRFWSKAQEIVDARRRKPIDGRSVYPHHIAATELMKRGFDAVVLGHTHAPERTELPDGVFVNSGSWMKGADLVRIEHGEITIGSWSRSAAAA